MAKMHCGGRVADYEQAHPSDTSERLCQACHSMQRRGERPHRFLQSATDVQFPVGAFCTMEQVPHAHVYAYVESRKPRLTIGQMAKLGLQQVPVVRRPEDITDLETLLGPVFAHRIEPMRMTQCYHTNQVEECTHGWNEVALVVSEKQFLCTCVLLQHLLPRFEVAHVAVETAIHIVRRQVHGLVCDVFSDVAGATLRCPRWPKAPGPLSYL